MRLLQLRPEVNDLLLQRLVLLFEASIGVSLLLNSRTQAEKGVKGCEGETWRERTQTDRQTAWRKQLETLRGCQPCEHLRRSSTLESLFKALPRILRPSFQHSQILWENRPHHCVLTSSEIIKTASLHERLRLAGCRGAAARRPHSSGKGV